MCIFVQRTSVRFSLTKPPPSLNVVVHLFQHRNGASLLVQRRAASLSFLWHTDTEFGLFISRSLTKAMPDPLSVVAAAASVTQPADVALGTSRQLYKFFWAIKDARKESQQYLTCESRHMDQQI